MNQKENSILQFLLGEVRIEADGGYYVLVIQDWGDWIHVTIDYERTETVDDLFPIGRKCVFNVAYGTDPYGRNPFSFGALINDLHEHGLEAVEEWLVEFICTH